MGGSISWYTEVMKLEVWLTLWAGKVGSGRSLECNFRTARFTALGGIEGSPTRPVVLELEGRSSSASAPGLART